MMKKSAATMSSNCRCKVSRDVSVNPKYDVRPSLVERRPCTPCRCTVQRDIVKSRSLQSIPRGELVDNTTQTTPSIEGDDLDDDDMSEIIFAVEPPSDLEVSFVDDLPGFSKPGERFDAKLYSALSDANTSGYASSLGTNKEKSIFSPSDTADSISKPAIIISSYERKPNVKNSSSFCGDLGYSNHSHLSPDYVPRSHSSYNTLHDGPLKKRDSFSKSMSNGLGKQNRHFSSTSNLDRSSIYGYDNLYNVPSCNDYLKDYNRSGMQPKDNYKLHYTSDLKSNSSLNNDNYSGAKNGMPSNLLNGTTDYHLPAYRYTQPHSTPTYDYVRGLSSLYPHENQHHTTPLRNFSYAKNPLTGRPPIEMRPPVAPQRRIPAKYDLGPKPLIPNYSLPVNYGSQTRTNFPSTYKPLSSPKYDFDLSPTGTQPLYNSPLSYQYGSTGNLRPTSNDTSGVPNSGGSYIGPSKWSSVPDLRNNGINKILSTSNAWLHKIQDTLDAGTQTKPGSLNGYQKNHIATSPSKYVPRSDYQAANRSKYGKSTMPRTYSSPIKKRSMPPQSIDNDNINELKELFDILDRNKDGKVSRAEINAAKPTLVYRANRRFLEDVLDCLRMTRKTYITFAELMRFYLTSARHLAEEYRYIQKMFKWLDPDGKGYISDNDLRYVAAEHGIFLTSKAIRQVIEEADIDQDGCVTFDDFIYIMLKAKLTGDED